MSAGHDGRVWVAFGAQLRELRNSTGRSLDEVARRGWNEEAKLAGSQIGQYERGEKRPEYGTLLAILDGIGLPREDWPPLVRLHVLRGSLDEREFPHGNGLDPALAKLASL